MFTWKEVLKGLDSGLDIAKYVAALIPGGQVVAAGLIVADNIVEKINSTYENDPILDNKIMSESEPQPEMDSIDTIVILLESIVQSQSTDKEIVITDEAVIRIIEVMSKSRGNNIDDKLITRIKKYLIPVKSIKKIKTK